MNFKKWSKETFSTKRIVTSLTFSVIVYLTYWAITIYESVSGNFFLTIVTVLVVFLIMLLFGGSFLDVMSKD